MNEAVAVSTDGFLTTADLAGRPDFTLGLTAVSPSMRTIAGPGGTADVEPRVMQVLLVLADAAGQVVTRETLFRRCWGNPFVGDDSLNRAVGSVRKLAIEIGGGSFGVETVPRTGYRLTAALGGPIAGTAKEGKDQTQARISRRGAVAGGIAAATLVGGGLWRATQWRTGSRFDALMAQGDEAFRNGTAFEDWAVRSNNNPDMVKLYEDAVRLRPGSARAWGLLGYFRSTRTDVATKQDSPRAVAESQAAIRRALKLDPTEPNARVGMYLLQGSMFDWAERDRRLRGILTTDPGNIPAMLELMPLIQAAGLTRESWTWNERILRASPFLRGGLVVRALKLWILGKVREADNVIDRVRGLWPDYWFGAYGRFIIFALTGRPAAARAMLDDVHFFDGFPSKNTWLTTLGALDSRTPAAIETARLACLETAHALPALANDMVMMLGALGLNDTAFEVTEGFLLWRGKFISMDRANGKAVDDYNRRMTQWLFTPPLAAMRADPRFANLCDEFGLSAYWRARHVQPDYLVYG